MLGVGVRARDEIPGSWPRAFEGFLVLKRYSLVGCVKNSGGGCLFLGPGELATLEGLGSVWPRELVVRHGHIGRLA
jgi:hypothetical protein